VLNNAQDAAGFKCCIKGSEVLMFLAGHNPVMHIAKCQRHVGRKRWEALFPSYLFVQTCDETQSIAPIRSTLGVSQLVRFGTVPATVSHAVVEQVVQVAASLSAREEAVVHGLTAGTPVRLVEGPLKGLEGLVTASAQDRVFVLLEIMGREVTVQAQARALRAA